MVGDRYRVLHELGRGGMGVVYAAEHLQLPQRVAIKLMLHAVEGEAKTRFLREAELVVQLRSQHVGKVLDVGALPDGEPYMVMELLEGMDLEQRLQHHGPLALEDVLRHAIEAAEALAEAHCRGIVHRDLKPSNLFLAQGLGGAFTIKVLDFGIAKVGGTPTAAGLTQSGAMMGTPYFMAPEQLVSSRDVDARADVWALGATLYQLLTGRLPFDGKTLAEVHVAILKEMPTPLSELRPDLPPAVTGAIMRCLQKEPWDRHGSMAELVAALAPAAPADVQSTAERVRRAFGGGAIPAGVGGGAAAVSGGVEGMAPGVATRIAPGMGTGIAPGMGTGIAPGMGTEGPVVSAVPQPPKRSVPWVALVALLGIVVGGGALLATVLLVREPRAPTRDGRSPLRACAGIRCKDALRIDGERPLEPEKLLDEVRAFAREEDPSAELEMILVTGMVDGRVAHGRGFVTYLFRASDPTEPNLAVALDEQGAALATRSSPAGTAVPPPSCPMQKALKVIYDVGVCGRRQPVTAQYASGGPKSSVEAFWQISCSAGGGFVAGACQYHSRMP